MAAILQLRRGTTASKPTLSAGEMYVNTTSQSLQLSIDGSTEITLAKLNSVNSGSFNVSGDITLGGTITIGDNATADNVVFNADLSSSIIPNNDTTFDLGSNSFRYRNIYATSISGAIASTNGVISGSSQLTLLNAFTASANGHITDINTKTGSFETKNLSLATISGSLILTASFLEAKNVSLATVTGSLITSSSTDAGKFLTISSVTSSYNSVTASLNTYTASAETKFTSIATVSGSLISTASFLEAKNLSLATISGSLISSASTDSGKFATLATYTASLETKNSSLATVSGSLILTASFLEAKNLSLATTTGSLITSSSTDASKFLTLATYTSSLNVWTSSVATTGSNTFIGNEIITGSLTVTGSVKGNVIPITIASSTASLNMNLGNYFTLTLANNTNTHIIATNITPGITTTLLITTGTNSSASLAPTLLQPLNSSYTASLGSGKKDVLSLTSFDSTNMYVVSTLGY